MTVDEPIPAAVLLLQMIRNRVANKSISAFHLAFYKAALPVMIQRLEMLPPEYVAALAGCEPRPPRL